MVYPIFPCHVGLGNVVQVFVCSPQGTEALFKDNACQFRPYLLRILNELATSDKTLLYLEPQDVELCRKALCRLEAGIEQRNQHRRELEHVLKNPQRQTGQ
eukprot:m.392953 g.392953  ORF g.392953 m.392953 type:complete len:101 (-) comp20088_c6_seq2:2133-2435(-)